MLCGQLPPIQKMDGNLGRLVRCEQLGISSNNIEKITGLKALKNLKILSIGRNCLKKFDGVGLLCTFSVSLFLAFYIFPFYSLLSIFILYRLSFSLSPFSFHSIFTPHTTVLSSSSVTYEKKFDSNRILNNKSTRYHFLYTH